MTTSIDRRTVIKSGAFLAGSAIVATQFPRIFEAGRGERAYASGEDYPLSSPENLIYSACQQCNTQCGIKVKIEDGLIAKIDGNPYSPWNMVPQIPYGTAVTSAAQVDGMLCPKGQAGIQAAYDPYRIVRVLKRAGKRGENRWTSIPFERAVAEIVEGGVLFKDVPGEETRTVEGLKDLWAVRDAALLKTLKEDAAKVAKKTMSLADFKAKHRADLDKLIDPDHPDLGPKNDQILFFWGRMKAGRSNFVHRLFGEGLGTVNRHGHTTVCQGSLYFTGKAMTEQFRLDEADGKMKWTGGTKAYWMADVENAEFILFVGASPFEGNYGPTNRAPRITEGLASGRLRFAVVDPRLSKIASKAWRWVPIRPGTEGAMALGVTRWILDEKRYDAKYLANANAAAAKADKEPTWTNAAWLVKIEKGEPGALLRGSDIGLPTATRTFKKSGADVPYTFDPFVVMKDGKPIAFDPYDANVVVEGDPLVYAEINGIKVKTGLQVLADGARQRTVAQWASESGIKTEDISEVARELTSHGKRAAVDIHRGVSQHTNGFYNATAWFGVNLLIGNQNWKGGTSWASTYEPAGTKKVTTKRADGTDEMWTQPFDIGAMNPGKLSPWGVSLIRENVKYEDTTIYNGYPAKRRWYPLASDVYQEIVPSIASAYPYPIKAAFMYMGAPTYSLPAGHKVIELIQDVARLPLFVANDMLIGETSMYADYIFPDVSYLERWEFSGSHPSIGTKVQGIRQPVIAPLVETAKVFGQDQPLTFETMILGLAEKLGLPNFGPNGFGAGKALRHQDDFYLRMVANLAAGDKPTDTVPDASVEEMRLFVEARRHLPKTVFDADRWKAIVGDALWPKVVYVLNRGGRFAAPEQTYDGEVLREGYKGYINLYQEKTAKTKDTMTGKYFSGVAIYAPGPTDALGRKLDDEATGHDLRLITFREIMHTKSRTAANYWLQALLPENSLIMNPSDARRLSLTNGDTVRVRSASNADGVWNFGPTGTRAIVGKLRILEGIRPGVVAFSLGHGHWAAGARDVEVDRSTVRGDERRGRGIHANAAMRVDPAQPDMCLTDPVGASAVFYDTQVRVTKET